MIILLLDIGIVSLNYVITYNRLHYKKNSRIS